MATASMMRKMAENDVKESLDAFKSAKVGGDGTQGASQEDKDRMTFKPNPHAGVWGNEESYQMSMKHYTKFLGDHPVWGNKAITGQYPIMQAKDTRYPTYTQATWWPSGKTTLYQYCNCHEKKESSRYKTRKMRRNHCPECGYWQDKHEDEYDWDPVVDKNRGKPEIGNVIESVHDVRGVAYDESHRNAGLITEKQRVVGKARYVGGMGNIGESYDANLHTRQRETSTPDGPAFYRMKKRNNDLQQQMEDKKKAELIAKVQKKSESQLRSEARNREPKFIEGMTVKVEWELGEPMPYGARDEPEKEVEGPARRRMEKRMKTKMELMKQPHNVTDRVAYAKGNILKEMQEEERAGKIGKALKYYKMVSEGRKGVMKEIMEEDKHMEIKRREEEKRVLEERRSTRIAETKKTSAAKGSMGRGNVKDRMMARTTFGMKSLHSDKYVEQQRRKMSKYLNADEDEAKKRRGKRRKRKKRKKKKKEDEDEGEEEEGEAWEQEEKKAKEERRKEKKERRRLKEIEKVKQGTMNIIGRHQGGEAGEMDDEGSVGSLVSQGSLVIMDLSAQQANYQARIEREKAEKEDAQKESGIGSWSRKGKQVVMEERVEAKEKEELEGNKALGEGETTTMGGLITTGITTGVDLEKGEGEGEGESGLEKAAEEEQVQEALLFKIGWLVYQIGAWTAWLLERPLLVVPHKYNPYKQWRARQIAKHIMRESTGASFMESQMGNKFKKSPVMFVVDWITQFLHEKYRRLQIAMTSIFLYLYRVITRHNRIYTYDDLEGGAYDGDNSLVVRCFAQKLRKGTAKLNVNGRTPDGKTPIQCCFEGLLDVDRRAKEEEKKKDAEEAERIAEAVEDGEGEAKVRGRMLLSGMMTGLNRVAKIAGIKVDPVKKYNRTLATLLSMGADVLLPQDVESSDGYSLIHLAAAAGNCKRLAWLLTKGAQVDTPTLLDGMTPLHVACMKGQSEACMMLLTRGAQTDPRDKHGRTPLHLAAESGGTHTTRVMLLCGARKGIWDDKGKTPFDYAVRMGRPSTVESLLVFRAPKMNSRQNLNFLFHKMLADGEHKEKRQMARLERGVDDVGDVAKEGVRKGMSLLKWGANMVKNGARVADGAARGDNETPKMREEREKREAEVKAGGGALRIGARKTWGKVAMSLKAITKSKEVVDLDAVEDDFGLEP
ncbi:hypothetical protein TrRE_jg3884 [Triparma retinervis]|uniref:Uncharacterized protein n=1 Tax=Triparma retinervis TaxID=2557542 RepID=A0A9W7AKR5_9STRA|nr:hypothetical protein TrRE_jg3884 [Triparma retinervis]